MCDPISAGMGMGAVGSIVGGAQSAKAHRMNAAVASQQAGYAEAASVINATLAEQRGQRAREIANINAGFLEEKADQIEIAGAFAEDRLLERLDRVQGSFTANTAAAGGELTGSALDILADNARQAELDRVAINYTTKVEARAARADAVVSRYTGEVEEWMSAIEAASIRLSGQATAAAYRGQASIDRQNANSAMIGGLFGAANSMVSGWGKMNTLRTAERRLGVA